MANELNVTVPDDLPIIVIERDFDAPVEAVHRAHTNPDLFARWIGPDGYTTKIDTWDMRTGGEYRFLNITPEGEEHGFRGCFHDVREDRIVQTFTWEPMPDSVSLETLTLEDLGDGRTRLHVTSLMESFEARDGMVASGMADGMEAGYRKLDALLPTLEPAS